MGLQEVEQKVAWRGLEGGEGGVVVKSEEHVKFSRRMQSDGAVNPLKRGIRRCNRSKF